MMRLCLERCADLNWADKEGRTILYDACKNDRVDAVRLLLDKGAEVNRATKKGTTPLIIACALGHVDAARLLLDKGATVDRETDWGTPLSIAKQQGHSSIVSLLEEHQK